MLLRRRKVHTNRTHPWINIAKLLNVSTEQAKRSTQDKTGFAALVDRVVAMQLHGNIITVWRI